MTNHNYWAQTSTLQTTLPQRNVTGISRAMNAEVGSLSLEEARSALGRGTKDPYVFNVLAWHEAQAGNYEAAHNNLDHASILAPHDVLTMTSRAALYREQGRLRDAVLQCDAAIALAPNYAGAWLERGFVMTAGGSIDAAFECYAEATRLDPGNAAAWAGSAGIAARRGDMAMVRDYAGRALTIDPENAIATCALATMEIDTRDAGSAAVRLTRLLASDHSPSPENAVALNLLGDAYDRLGDANAAFDAYKKGKAMFALIHTGQSAGKQQTHRDFVEMIIDGLASMTDVSGWALPTESAEPKHVFLLGYPRSGTTLVENILASLPNTTALEERPTLRESDQAFLTTPEGIAQLAALNTVAARPFREAYWAKVTAARALPPSGGTFVDMDPLKATRLPIIARLFPTACILAMRRDPRDVVWSCFHTNFALTSSALEFTDLERTALHYDATMRLTELCIDSLPLKLNIVRYDRIVRDFDAETKRLCAFIGVPWSDSLRHFDRTAKLRGVSTASAAQVRKPLYDGTRQWERYAEHLAPVMPILQPWIDKFGFDS